AVPAREREPPGRRIGEDRRDRGLPCALAVERARERRGPESEAERGAGGDSRSGARNPHRAAAERDDVRTLAPSLLEDPLPQRRLRPVNILLLIVPTGCPSRSASSDCVNPP